MSPVHRETECGHAAVHLENDLLRVTVLPGKGADIYRLIDLRTGVDCLMKTPSGLRPPSHRPQKEFLDNYEGGWQELFPSGNAACTYRGAAVPFHGEAALRPWDAEVLESGRGARVRFSTSTTILPFDLTKTLTLAPSEPVLEVHWTVENRRHEPLHYSWGQHLVLGAPFLEGGCWLDVPAGNITTDPVTPEPGAAVLAAGQNEPWPLAAGRRGERIDLRHIPGPETHTHDDVFLGGLERGFCRVTNPRLNLALTLEWDPEFHRYLALWMPYGGAEAPPLAGIYGLGIEPFVSRDNLAGAVEAGEARLLAPGEVHRTSLRVSFDTPGAD